MHSSNVSLEETDRAVWSIPSVRKNVCKQTVGEWMDGKNPEAEAPEGM